MGVGLLYRGIPDSGFAPLVRNQNGSVSPVLQNRVILSKGIHEALAPVSASVWGPLAEELPENTRWIINLCADADFYSKALASLRSAIDGKPISVFNHPDAVDRSRRDKVSKSIAGISGLVVPKCVRFLANTPESFLTAFQENDFEYPVMVRPAGSQSGRSLVRIDGPDDWDRVHKIPWPQNYIFMTQFVDCHVDGMNTKIRVVSAGENISFRHVVKSTDWIVRPGKRSNEDADEELEFLSSSPHLPKLKKIGTEIRDKIGLDFFAMDIGIVEDRYVFFEASAAVSVLTTKLLGDYRQDDYLGLLRKIETDVVTAMNSKLFLSSQT